MAGNAKAAFTPNSAATVTVAATTTSGSTRVALVGTGPNVLITNAGSATAFVELGTSTGTSAVATGIPVLSGEVLCLGIVPSMTHAIAITASGTATVYVTTGDGD